MAIVQFLQFDDVDTSNDKIQTTVKTVAELSNGAPNHVLFGTDIKDKETLQITSESTSTQDFSNLITHLETQFNSPTQAYRVAFNRSTFGRSGALTYPVTEYVWSYFPVSRATPEFQAQIEADFERFNRLAFNDASGAKGGDYAFGWVEQEQDHEEVKGEKTRDFLIARGWDSMASFENFMQTDEAREHLPILLSWGAPFKMWHVEQRAIVGARDDA